MGITDKISKEAWYLEHGVKPSDRLDKNVVKIISMEEKNVYNTCLRDK
jgi:hypothetical protein